MVEKWVSHLHQGQKQTHTHTRARARTHTHVQLASYTRLIAQTTAELRICGYDREKQTNEWMN